MVSYKKSGLMNTKKIFVSGGLVMSKLELFVAVSCVSLAVSAVEYTAAWSTGENPASLADGKVTLTYEGEGADARIAAIAANPGYGNSVVVSGDTMALAENPVFTVGAGTVVFSNALDGTGTLLCRPETDESTVVWSNATTYISKYPNWKTIFPGKHLSDFEPVSSRGPASAYNPNSMTAYNSKRYTEDDTDFLDFQLQYSTSNATYACSLKCVCVTLKQTDAGIAATVKANYFLSNGSQRFDGEDVVYMAENPREFYPSVNTSYATVESSDETAGYGVNHLVMRRIGGFPQVRLEGVVTNTAADALLPVSVAAGASVWAGNGSGIGRLPTGASVSNAGEFTFGNIASNITASDPSTYHKGSLYCSGILRFASDDCESNGLEYSQEPYLKTGWITIGTGLTPYDVANFTGKINGSYVGSGKDSILSLYHYKVSDNGLVATGQVQALTASTTLRCIVMEFRSNGYILQMRATGSCYCSKTSTAGSYTPGYDFVTAYANGADLSTANFVATADGKGYAIHDFKVLFSKPDAYTIREDPSETLSIANGSRVEVAGTDSRRMQVEFRKPGSLPRNGVLEVLNGGCAVFDSADSYNTSETNYFANGSCLFRVHAGGMLCQRSRWAIGDAQRIELLGGTLWCGYVTHSDSQCYNYASLIEFQDGASVKGLSPLRVGFSTAKPLWKVRGTSASSCDMNVMLFSYRANGWREFMWDVADVTDSAEIDFNMNGWLSRSTTENTYTNITMVKTGKGTVALNAECPANAGVPGLTTIRTGTWLLNVSDAMRGTPVCLDGGMLAAAAGTANTLGPLSIAVLGGRISLGEGATLSFADSGSETWAAAEKVAVSGFAEKAIRFGASKAAAPRSKMFVTDGGDPLRVDKDGYLTAVMVGVVFSIR